MGVLIAALVLTVHQALPPPGDGEIRAVYWELRNEAEVWLTIEPRSAGGKTAPQGMTLTLTRRFAGKWPDNQPRRFEIRANAGLLWNPKNELWIVIDGPEKIDFVGQNPYGPISGEFSTYVTAELPIETLDRLARASRVTGNALGLEFELTPSQRQAVREFFDRAMSDNPTRLPRNPCCHTERRRGASQDRPPVSWCRGLCR
jgi:hypothetical protein